MTRKQFIRRAGIGVAALGAAGLGLSGTANAAPSLILDVYPSGEFPYVGKDGLLRAVTDISPGGTIYVHAGTYDLGTDIIKIEKSTRIIGVEGRPEIMSARPMPPMPLDLVGQPAGGVVEVNIQRPDLPPELYPGSLPDVPRECELNNLKLVSTALNIFSPPNPLYNLDTAVVCDFGSNKLNVVDCELLGANYGVLEGVYCASPVWVKGAPADKKYYAVTGDIIVQNTYMKTFLMSASVGWFGETYALDNVEFSACTCEQWGVPPLVMGTWGIIVAQYDYAALEEPDLAELVEGTKPTTLTVIRGNTVQCGMPIQTVELKGRQELTGNDVYAYGIIPWGGMLLNFGMAVSMHEDDKSANASIADNEIHHWLPFTIPLSGSFFFGDGLLRKGGLVNATVANNKACLDTFAGIPSAPVSTGMHTNGLPPTDVLPYNTTCFVSDSKFTGNDLSMLTTSRAQVDLNSDCMGNRFGPGNLLGPLILPTAIAAFVCGGDHNEITYNDFTNCNAPGWTASSLDGPGCIYLSEGSRGNYVRGNTFPAGTICTQVIDFDMHLGIIGASQGSQDAIPGYGVCQRNPEAAQRVQDALANPQQKIQPPAGALPSGLDSAAFGKTVRLSRR